MTKCMQSRGHQYIFEPVCASVLLRRNTSKEPLRSRNTPRIEGQVQLEPMSLRLSQVCVKSWCFFFSFFNSFNLLVSEVTWFHMFHLNTHMWLILRLWLRFELIFQTGLYYLWTICSCCFPDTFAITSVSNFEQIFWHGDIKSLIISNASNLPVGKALCFRAFFCPPPQSCERHISGTPLGKFFRL